MRQGYYAFSEYKTSADIILYFANKIYQPSYIGLYTALSFYGIIPETVYLNYKCNIFKNYDL